MAGGPEMHPDVQRDLVFLEYPSGGAVFSFSSIAWCGCLSHNAYVNNASLLTRNVLEGFLAPGSPPWKQVER
jgi:N,N-dimethylformamidase